MTSSEVDLLVRAAGAGDEHAWNSLVEQFSGLLWAVARSYRLDDATAADVVQECWYRLARNLDQIREPGRVAAWLTTTAKHESLRVLRRLDRQQPTDFEDERLLGVDSAADEALLDDERVDHLYEAMTRLSPKCQQLLRLCLAEPKIPYEEIAAIVDIPVGSIGPTRQRCLAKLRDILQTKGMGR